MQSSDNEKWEETLSEKKKWDSFSNAPVCGWRLWTRSIECWTLQSTKAVFWIHGVFQARDERQGIDWLCLGSLFAVIESLSYHIIDCSKILECFNKHILIKVWKLLYLLMRPTSTDIVRRYIAATTSCKHYYLSWRRHVICQQCKKLPSLPSLEK